MQSFIINYFLCAGDDNNIELIKEAKRKGLKNKDQLESLSYTAYEVELELKVYQKDNQVYKKVVKINGENTEDKNIFI